MLILLAASFGALKVFNQPATTAIKATPTATFAPLPTATATLMPTATVAATATSSPTATTAAQATATPAPPHLAVQPSAPVNGSWGCDTTSSTPYPSFSVQNTGGGTLTWSVNTNNGGVVASPPSGTLAPNASRTVTLSGTVGGSSVTVTFNSNGGSQQFTVTCG